MLESHSRGAWKASIPFSPVGVLGNLTGAVSVVGLVCTVGGNGAAAFGDVCLYREGRGRDARALKG